LSALPFSGLFKRKPMKLSTHALGARHMARSCLVFAVFCFASPAGAQPAAPGGEFPGAPTLADVETGRKAVEENAEQSLARPRR
jgi:hypothetical protein